MKSFDITESFARACSYAERFPLPAPSKVEGLASRASSDAPHSTLPVPSKVEGHAPRASRAFTLIELLVVMVVMVVILTISLPAFINMGRGMSLRAAVNSVRSTVALSRQWAITHREQITFVASSTGLVFTTNNLIVLATNDHACYYVTNAVGDLIQSITDLPLDVTLAFDGPGQNSTSLIFKTDGALNAFGNEKKIVLVDKRNPADAAKQRTITIKVLTGGIRVE